MRSRCSAVLMIFASLTQAQKSQRTPAPPPVYGSVTGRVTCVDTNLPARLAPVTLQSIDVKPEVTDWSKTVPRTLRTYQTGLDGSFAIPKVTPGTYYVVVQQAGYLSPVTQFTRAELQQPTPEILARVLKVVPVVTVEANHASNLEVRIERGAAISGTIRYDDGSPAVSTQVTVLGRETKAGKGVWGSSLYNFRATTNDQGQYRVTGLPGGEYLLRVRMEIEDMIEDGVLGSSGHSSSSTTRYQLHYFYGDTPRQDQGKPIKLQPGEQQDAADITIPIGKLHSIAGTLTNARNGQVVNAGKLTLHLSDGAELASTKVDPEDNTFRFDFVPEGEYTLAVTEAKDVAREPVPPKAGVAELPQTKDTTLREYGNASQPLIVQSDVSGLVVPLPTKAIRQMGAAQ